MYERKGARAQGRGHTAAARILEIKFVKISELWLVVLHQQAAASSSTIATTFHLQRQRKRFAFRQQHSDVRLRSSSVMRASFSHLGNMQAASNCLISDAGPVSAASHFNDIGAASAAATSVTTAPLQLLCCHHNSFSVSDYRHQHSTSAHVPRNRKPALYGCDAAPAAATSVMPAQLHCCYCDSRSSSTTRSTQRELQPHEQ